jgi:hypothetical protein
VNRFPGKTLRELLPIYVMTMLALSLRLAMMAQAADEIDVAAAADLTFAFKGITAKFSGADWRFGETIARVVR